jgi:hypothetical protein
MLTGIDLKEVFDKVYPTIDELQDTRSQLATYSLSCTQGSRLTSVAA